MNLLDAIDKLRVRKYKGRRTPHKPLLLLYALARQAKNPNRKAKFKFSRIEEDIQNLLSQFYRSLRFPNKHGVHYPFWRLQNDKGEIWKVHTSGNIEETSSDDAFLKDLRKYGTGSFSQNVIQEIGENPDIVLQATLKLLNEYFPKSLHRDILESVGFCGYRMVFAEKLYAEKTRRDEKFRKDIVCAYDYRCAVCGLDLYIGNLPVGLKASHIKWHKEGGPNTQDNGLALCGAHHKLFDLGALTLSEDYRIVLSELIYNPNAENKFIKEYGKKVIYLPRKRKYFPNPEYIDWHRKTVFKEPELILT